MVVTCNNAAVIGAAGKMGSGISLLLLQEMALQECRQPTGEQRLTLVDANDQGLSALKRYLAANLQKFAEKNINSLREALFLRADVVSNSDHVAAFIEAAWNIALFAGELESLREADVVFEAIVEDLSAKESLFRSIEACTKKKPFYFTNTSSIPIHVLSEAAGLQGRIIGFHFYNPPAVQKLLEIIPAKDTSQELIVLAKGLAAQLHKTAVFAKDVAGFIGNGHFMREIAYACEQVKQLGKEYSQPEAIAIMNRVTQDFLIRPMGIFQLVDYVGLDVCHNVLHVMSRYLKEPFNMSVIEEYVSKGITGGQNPDGTQKPGIFSYSHGKIDGMFTGQGYSSLPAPAIGALPEGWKSWKALQNDKNKEDALRFYFQHLFSSKEQGAVLAQHFLAFSCSVAEKLVQEGVAATMEDVDTVLQQGFYHLYGVCAPFTKEKR